MSKYTTKSDLKSATDFDTSHFAKKADLASLKSDVDYSNTKKWKTASTDSTNLSNSVESGVVKKAVYDELVKKVNVDQNNHINNLV